MITLVVLVCLKNLSFTDTKNELFVKLIKSPAAIILIILDLNDLIDIYDLNNLHLLILIWGLKLI